MIVVDKNMQNRNKARRRTIISWSILFIMVIILSFEVSAFKFTYNISYANFTFDNPAAIGADTGKGSPAVGTLANASWTTVANGINGNAMQTNNGFSESSFNTQIATGGISFWFKPVVNTASAGTGCFVTYDGAGNNKGDFSFGYGGCGVGAGGGLTLYFNNITGTQNITTTTTNFLAGTWYHIYAKINASQIAIYVNGVKEVSGYGSPNQAYFGTGATGYFFGGPGVNMNATFDEFKIFDIELTDNQINELYQIERATDRIFYRCTSPYSYLSLAFKDESTLSSLPASITLMTLNYTNATGYTTSTYYSATEATSYDFCLYPRNESINVSLDLNYRSTGYPQRTAYIPWLNLSNSTTSKSFYLLSSSDGIYVTIQVINAAEQPLQNVAVNFTREISGINTLLGQGLTGADGSITFWMNPDYAHTMNFLLSPYPLYSLTQSFTNTQYTVTLGSVTQANVTDLQKGINYTVLPSTSYLLNNTVYDFNFTINSSYWNLTSFGFTLTNGTYVIGSDVDSGYNGTTSLSVNTGSNKTICMNYYWIVNGSSASASKCWFIWNSGDTSFSIANFITDLKLYVSSGLFGLDINMGLGLISFLIILGVTGTMRIKHGINDDAAMIGVMFSLVALLDIGFGIIPNPVNAVPHFVTVFIGLLFAGFLFKEVYQ